MNFWSSDTFTLLGRARFSESWLPFIRWSKMSAIATRLIGGPLWSMAFFAAPVPRPPQPTSAILIVSLPAAWTKGMKMPASADAAAI